MKREVAIKILPAQFSRDPERIARFQREAETLAALNHPNIAAIHDLQEVNGSRFLVLELAGGETLADRLRRGSLPTDETLTIAKQICEALEAAHEKGITHRDLKKIVFAAVFEGRSRLWLRSLGSVSARPLAGTDFASYPFWSPDNRSVGFFADSKLKRIDIDGGSVQILANAPLPRGGTWNHENVILFGSGFQPIFRISATGGEPAALTRLQPPQQNAHISPQFLPDGRHFFYYVQGIPEARGIYIGQLGGSDSRRLLDADAAAVYASSGQLFFVRQGTLFAQNFDPARLALNANPFPVAEQFTVDGFGAAAVSASASGPIIYRSGSASGGARQFVWFDRSGKEIGRVGDPLSTIDFPSISPDGRRVAMARTVNGHTDVWLLEIGRSVLRRFTFDPAIEAAPLWSPDGNRIVFTSTRSGANFVQKPATGGGSEELLLALPNGGGATDWSRDRRFLLFRSIDPKMGYDIWALPLEGKPFPVVQTKLEERDGQFSPDGKWIAYQSNESGRFEIYVRPFPGPGGKWFPRMAALKYGGAATPRNCFTSRWMTG